jgi:succinyl-diaminopimelate desuccinylase
LEGRSRKEKRSSNLFPGRPDIARQKGEYIEMDDLVKATAIYAQAIYELAK